MAETASQDWNLQRTIEHAFVDRVEAVKIVPQKRISERMCEQLGVIEVPKNSRQECVKIVKIIPQEQMSERTGLTKCQGLWKEECRDHKCPSGAVF